MGELVDSWALKWLESRRELGKKGLILEKRSGSNQVRWQKISWNKETKKRDREVVYLGTLDFPGHLVLSKSLDLRAVRPEALDAAGIQLPPAPATFTINDQKCTGVMRLISAVSEDLMEALDRAFPKQIRDDLMMLAVARLAKSGRLVRAGGWFLRQENCMGLNPHVDPDNLSKTLEAVGSSPTAQQTFFDALPQRGRQFAFSIRYNRFKLTCGQFNIVIVCSIEDSLPQCMKTVAGNIRENSILGMLSEYGLGTDVILVMDRGYSDDGVLDMLLVRKVSLPTFLRLVGKYAKGLYRRYPQLICEYHGGEVTFSAPDPITVVVDGEVMEDTRFTVRLSERKVNFFYPEDCSYRIEKKIST